MIGNNTDRASEDDDDADSGGLVDGDNVSLSLGYEFVFLALDCLADFSGDFSSSFLPLDSVLLLAGVALFSFVRPVNLACLSVADPRFSIRVAVSFNHLVTLANK